MGKDLKDKELGEGLCQQKDGRYLGRYTDRYGKRHNIYGQKLKDVKEKLTKAKYEDTLGVDSYDTRLTFDDVFNKWFEMKLRTIREITCRRYKLVYEKRIKNEIGNIKITSIKPRDIENIFINCGGVNTFTVKKVLKGIFDYSINNQFIFKNVYNLSNIPKDKPAKKKAILNKNEESIFVNYCMEKVNMYNHRNYDLYVVLLYTGMRIGEATALLWSDIDFEKRIININKTLSFDLQERVIVNEPKTENSKRIIPMCDFVCNILIKKKEKYYYPNDIVFYSRNHCYHRIRTLEESMNKIVKNIQQEHPDFPRITPHCLRHTFATKCFEAGISPKIVQQYLGHSSMNITMDLYTHTTNELLFENIEKINYM